MPTITQRVTFTRKNGATGTDAPRISHRTITYTDTNRKAQRQAIIDAAADVAKISTKELFIDSSGNELLRAKIDGEVTPLFRFTLHTVPPAEPEEELADLFETGLAA